MIKIKKLILQFILMFLFIFFYSHKIPAETITENLEYSSTIPQLPSSKLIGIKCLYINYTFDKFNLNTIRLESQGLIGSYNNCFTIGVDWQNLFSFNPAIINQIVKWKDGAHTNDVDFSFGYRIGYKDLLYFNPYLNFKYIFSFGMLDDIFVNDNYMGMSIGSVLEYHLYPETTIINLKVSWSNLLYHFNNIGIPDKTSLLELPILGLFNINIFCRYRLLDNLELLTGYQLWQLPTELGKGQLSRKLVFNLNGLILGVNILF